MAALSAMLSEALREDALAGVNVTLIVQVEFTVTTLPQLLVCAKLEAFVPVMEMPVMFNRALPVLVRLIVCAALVVP